MSDPPVSYEVQASIVNQIDRLLQPADQEDVHNTVKAQQLTSVQGFLPDVLCPENTILQVLIISD